MKHAVFYYLIKILLIVPFIGQSDAFAKKDDFKFSGRLGVGLVNSPDENDDFKSDFEMRFQAASKRKQGYKGVLELRGDEGTRTVSIQDAFVDYKNEDKDQRVRFGRGKKILGWQWEYPTAARLTINRTQAYDFLSQRNLTGRDYFASYVWTVKQDEPPEVTVDETDADAPEEKDSISFKTLTDTSYFDPDRMIDPLEKWKFEIAGHLNEADDVTLIVSAIRTLNSNLRVGAWLLGGRAQSVTQVQGIWAGTLSALYRQSIHRVEVELFSGADPYRTEINRLYGGGRPVQFAAARANYGLYLARWNPYLSADCVWKDFADRANRAYQGIAGLRYFLTPGLTLTGEGSLLTSLSGNDPTSYPFHDHEVRVLARYFF